MNKELRENTLHGTSEYPFALYSITCLSRPLHTFLHWHNEVEIIYIESGRLSIGINEDIYEGNTGDIYIVNSKEIHEMHATDLTVKYHTIIFPLNSLGFMIMDNVNNDFLLPISEGRVAFKHTVENNEVNEVIIGILQDIIRLKREKTEAYQLGIRIYLLQLIYTLYTYKQLNYNPQRHRDREFHREIISYISENYTGRIMLDEIAENFHMSPKYFSRYFKNTFQITLSTYISHLRMEKAVELLKETDYSITEISNQCGYPNISYFNRTFKENFGVSPKIYRNSNGENNE